MIPARVLSIPALLLLIGAIVFPIISILALPIMAILVLPYTYIALDIERRLSRTPNIVLVVLGILTAGLVVPLYLHRIYVECAKEKHTKTVS
jgi:Flp pilus assembly protein TadB